MFDEQLYPSTFSGESSLEASAWLDGAIAERKLMSLKPEVHFMQDHNHVPFGFIPFVGSM